MQSKMMSPTMMKELKARKGMLVVTRGGGSSLRIYMPESYIINLLTASSQKMMDFV